MKSHKIAIIKVALLSTLVSSVASSFIWGYRLNALQAELKEATTITQPQVSYAPVNQEKPIGGIEVDMSDIQRVFLKEEFLDYSSPFGLRYSPFTGKIVHHNGLDLYGVWHAQILSPGDGVVIEHWVPPGQVPGFVGHEVLGGVLKIKLDTGEIVTLGHLSTTFVLGGSRVKEGQVVGRQGNTGQSMGEHLHFEVERDGEKIDPFLWFLEPHR